MSSFFFFQTITTITNWKIFCFNRDVEIGDVVTVGECRPLSKTVKYNVLKVTKTSGSKKGFSKV